VKAGNSRAPLRPIGVIRSILKTRREAPMQGSEGAPDAWLEVNSFATRGLDGLAVGDEIIILTWLHRARRDVLKVHPRSDPRRPLPASLRPDLPTGQTHWGFIASPCARSSGTGCGSARSKPSTERRSLTSSRFSLASKTSSPSFGASLRHGTASVHALGYMVPRC